MLLNVSYNNPEVKRKIINEVGPPFTIRERLKMRGIGSSKLFITSTSIEIHNLLILDLKLRWSSLHKSSNQRLEIFNLKNVEKYFSLTNSG